MSVHLFHGRIGLICVVALVQAMVIDGAHAQYPKPLVPGSEKIVLGAFALHHPDVLAELRLDGKAFKDLHAELESQVRRVDGTDRQQGLHRPPLNCEQTEALNWLLLDSLSPTEGNRLIQLLNRQSVVLAQRPHDSRIVILPLPIFARPIQTQLRVAPQASDSLDQLFQANCGETQKRVEQYRASVNDELHGFLANAHEKLDEGTKAQLAALVGARFDRRLWLHDVRAPRTEGVLRRLQTGRGGGVLFQELWFTDSKSAMAVGPALNTLTHFLADNEDLAMNELNLTRAQMELISRAAAFGRAPLPTSPEWQSNFADRLQFLAHETHFQFRQQSTVRDEFIATLQPEQLTRFRELVNQVVLGDLPITWLAFDARVRHRLDLDGDCIGRLDESQQALEQGLERLQSEFRDDVWRTYRRTEQDALALLTVVQREQ